MPDILKSSVYATEDLRECCKILPYIAYLDLDLPDVGFLING